MHVDVFILAMLQLILCVDCSAAVIGVAGHLKV